jgi:hypothetical protein
MFFNTEVAEGRRVFGLQSQLITILSENDMTRLSTLRISWVGIPIFGLSISGCHPSAE